MRFSIQDIKLSIRAKLLVGYIAIGLFLYLALAVVGYYTASSIISSSITNDLTHITDNLLNLCKTTYDLNQRTVINNLKVADYFVRGKASIAPLINISMKIENQETGTVAEKRIPSLRIGGSDMAYNYELVDRITEMCGGTVTLFQRIEGPNGLLRISTSVKRNDGSRAVGTYIPENSPVYQSIMRGEEYHGAAYVVNNWYITAYRPIKAGGIIIGAVFVGVKQSELDILRGSIIANRIGERGFASVIDNHKNSRGLLVIHPQREGKNIYETKDADGMPYVKQMLERKNGIARHYLSDEKGETRERLLSYRYLKEMDWLIVAEADVEEMYSSLGTLRKLMLFISVIAAIVIAFVSLHLSRSFQIVVDAMRNRLNQMKDGHFEEKLTETITNRGDEFGEMAVHFNQLIENIREVLKKNIESIEVLSRSIQDLTVTSNEVSTTSNQQAASVKEIVSTMEDSDQLSKKVAAQISEVARIAMRNRELVEQGYVQITGNMEKMDEINLSNTEMMSSISNLGERIESIGEVLKLINSIADQTKIIAFNAELEASAAGEAGKNFQVVASEVRRLADSTMKATAEIRGRIQEVQDSSRKLGVSSDMANVRIREGYEYTLKVKGIFGDIQTSSEVSARSSEQIVMLVKEQVSAFEQILITLRQISESIDYLTISTKSTSGAAESLQGISIELRKLMEHYTV